MSIATENLEDIARMLPGYDPWQQKEDCHFDADSAAFHIEFIEQCCTFTQGPKTGQPFILEPWQKAVTANLYGWRRPDGSRRYRVAFIFVACGNGKSELLAAYICDSLFVPDRYNEPGGHVYSAAGKKDQTKYVFDPVCKMVEQCPEMASRARVFVRSVEVGDRTYWPMARETHTGTEHGGATHFAAVDEVHAHLDDRLIVACKRGMVKRKQPLMVAASTSDWEREGSPCNALHDYATKVRDNLAHDPSFLPVIYEATKDDDWTSLETAAKANPNYGVSVDATNFQILLQNAKNDPLFENEFKRLHLNIRTEQAQRLIKMADWDACQGDLPDLHGLPCWCGLDLGATRDFSAFVAVFPLGDRRYALKPIFWIPESAAVDRRNRMGATFLAWERAKLLRITTKYHEADYQQIQADIAAFAKEHDVREVAADPLFQGKDTTQRLIDEYGITVIEHKQGAVAMALPMRLFMEAIGDHRLVHDGHRVLRWMVSNLAGVQDRVGNWLPSKKHSPEKIDGVLGSIMGLARAIANEGGPKQSFLEDHPEAEVG